MSTVRDLLGDALRLINVLADGENPSASDLSTGLRSLNRMMSRWSTQNLLIYAKVREEFSLVAGQASYTMGTGGDFNSTRPMRVEHAAVMVDSVETPIEIVTLGEWALITTKTTQSSIPTKLYFEGTYPLETAKYWPVPSENRTAVLYSWKPISEFASANTSVSLPPGHEDAIVYNLALRLAPEYGKEPSALVITEARDSLADIKRMNIKPMDLKCDPAMLSGRGRINIFTGN